MAAPLPPPRAVAHRSPAARAPPRSLLLLLAVSAALSLLAAPVREPRRARGAVAGADARQGRAEPAPGMPAKLLAPRQATRGARQNVLGVMLARATAGFVRAAPEPEMEGEDDTAEDDGWEVAEADLGDRSDSPSELWKREEKKRAAEDAQKRYARWFAKKGSLIFVKRRGWVPRASLPPDERARLEAAEQRDAQAKHLSERLGKHSDERDVVDSVVRTERLAIRRQEQKERQRLADEKLRAEYRAQGGIDRRRRRVL